VSAIVLSRTGPVLRYITFCNLPVVHSLSLLGHDDALYNDRLCGGLRDPWQVATFGGDPVMLGSPVCKHELDV
jgi:hypothetical protein